MALVLLPASTVSAQAEPPDTGAAGIEGPAWQLVEYRDAEDQLVLVPPGITASAQLWAGRVGGESACSRFASTYTLQAERLVVAEPQVNARACDPTAQGIDDIFYAGLTQAQSWSRDGSALELRDATGETLLVFTAARVPNDPTIAPWSLTRITAADGTTGPTIAGSEPTATFLPGGRVVGSTGCGSFIAAWEANDTQLKIGDLRYRIGDCTPELEAQAEVIMSTLEEVTGFGVRPAGLTLTDATGATRLAWAPDIPLSLHAWTPIQVLGPDGRTAFGPDVLGTSSLSFLAGRVAGRTPCRIFDGGSQRSGLALSIFDVKRVKGVCRQKKPENAYVAALQRVASHALRGSTLELLDNEGTPVIRLEPQPHVEGVRWQVTAIDQSGGRGKTRLEPTRDPEPTIAFEGPSAVGSTGRNRFSAFYELVGPRLTVDTPLLSGKPCSGAKAGKPSCRQEQQFLQLITDDDRGADSYIALPGRLQLVRGNRVLMELAPTGDVEAEPEPEPAA
jgi:heat shock protein HslJ